MWPSFSHPSLHSRITRPSESWPGSNRLKRLEDDCELYVNMDDHPRRGYDKGQ